MIKPLARTKSLAGLQGPLEPWLTFPLPFPVQCFRSIVFPEHTSHVLSCPITLFPQRAAGRRPVRTGPGPAARPRAQAAALPTSKMVLWWMEVVLQSGLPSPLHGALCRPREEKAVHSFLMFPVTRRVPLRRLFQSPI